MMKERSVVIKTRDGEYLIVPKDQLTANSPKFKRIFDELKHDEHKIKDFSPEAVKTFINLLEKRLLGHLEDSVFREIHKLAVVFEVKWLKESCRGWLKNKMVNTSSTEEKIFLFEECWFMVDKWNDEAMMDQLFSVFAHENNESLLTVYFSDITKLKTGQIDALLKVGGVNVEVFLRIILQIVSGQKTLDPKLKYLLQNLNLAFCSEVHDELYLEVMDEISNLSEISVADLRFVQQLNTNTARLVRSRKLFRIERTSSASAYIDDIKFQSMTCSRKLEYVLEAVTEKIITSMFSVIELLLMDIFLENPGIEDLEIFLVSLENICSERKLQKVSRELLENWIAALSHSNLDQIDIVLIFMNKIKNNKLLCTTYENVKIQHLWTKPGT